MNKGLFCRIGWHVWIRSPLDAKRRTCWFCDEVER